jgi:glycolate oxidase FAD binding subunit
VPSSIDDVVDAIRDLSGRGRVAGIAGAGSEWSSMPAPEVDAIIDMSGYAGIVDHEADDLTLTVRAGTTLRSLDEALVGAHQTAVLPERSRGRTVGGVVGSGASGYRRLRYGPTRDRVIGVELVTGYGRRVRGGGRLVKNVTGYDLPRLVTGSRGGLGVITEVTFKLWPRPRTTATVAVSDASAAYALTYRPAAVLETPSGGFVYLEGSEGSVTAAITDLDGRSEPRHRWPDPPTQPVVLSVRVPPRHVDAAVEAIRGWAAPWWVAQHGVGVVDVGLDEADLADLSTKRDQMRAWSGVVVVDRWPDAPRLVDRFGPTARTAGVEDRLRSLFDPTAILRAASMWELQ